MRIQIELIGNTALLMHNERLSDQDDKFAKAIKEITDKGQNQTETDKATRSAYEWRGGLYTTDDTDNALIIIPTPNQVRCFREAAAVTKDGKNIARGLTPSALWTHLLIPEKSDENGAPALSGKEKPLRVKDVMNKAEFINNRQVKVQRGRIKRTRPVFPRWALITEFELIDDVLNFSTLTKIVDLAGRAVGLCDGRIIGYGRFTAKVTKVKES